MVSITVRERRALRAAALDALHRADEQVASLSRSLDDIVDAATMSNVDDEHDPEGATIAFERAQVSALLDQARADSGSLRATLHRIDEDSYGVCVECQRFIGVERLLALPATTRCVDCARGSTTLR